jgi:hypothetical protein
VSTAPKPTTLCRVESNGITRWKSSLSTYTSSTLNASKKNVLGMCIVKMIPFTPRSQFQNEVFSLVVLFFSARPGFRYKKHSRLACVQKHWGGIALMNGACHLNQGHNTICMSWPRC